MIPTRGASTSISSKALLDLGVRVSGASGSARWSRRRVRARGSPWALSSSPPARRRARRCRSGTGRPRSRCCSTAAYARARASSTESARGRYVQHPAAGGHDSSPRRAVPAVRDLDCSLSGRLEAARSRRPCWRRPGSPRRRARPSPPSRRTSRAARPRARPGSTQASSASSRSLRRRGSTACVSGSPKRQLNSSTFGPAAVIISPAYRTPWNGVPRCLKRVDDRLVHRRGRSPRRARRRCPGTGE